VVEHTVHLVDPDELVGLMGGHPGILLLVPQNGLRSGAVIPAPLPVGTLLIPAVVLSRPLNELLHGQGVKRPVPGHLPELGGGKVVDETDVLGVLSGPAVRGHYDVERVMGSDLGLIADDPLEADLDKFPALAQRGGGHEQLPAEGALEVPYLILVVQVTHNLPDVPGHALGPDIIGHDHTGLRLGPVVPAHAQIADPLAAYVVDQVPDLGEGTLHVVLDEPAEELLDGGGL
jgi:hypothetical protein